MDLHRRVWKLHSISRVPDESNGLIQLRWAGARLAYSFLILRGSFGSLESRCSRAPWIWGERGARRKVGLKRHSVLRLSRDLLLTARDKIRESVSRFKKSIIFAASTNDDFL